jgi:ABC-2 type transport system permease protein
MSVFFAIWGRELKSHFVSSVAYVTMTVFLVMTGATFLLAVQNKVGSEEPLTAILFVAVCFWMPILVTVVSMRLFAEEKRQGTLESLMTAPVGEWEVVLGKYAGALSVIVLAMTPALGNLLLLQAASPAIEKIDSGALLGVCLLLLLLTALCTSMGMLASLLTQNQIVAAMCCFAAVCLPFLAEPAAALLPIVPDAVVRYVALEQHLAECSQGLVSLQVLALYVSGIAFFIFASVRALEARQWIG